MATCENYIYALLHWNCENKGYKFLVRLLQPVKEMKIIAVPVKAKELKPGDLFSVIGPSYWENIDTKESIGEKVWLRTNTPTPLDQAEHEVYRIEIEEE